MSTPNIPPDETAGPWVDIDLAALCSNYAMIRDQAQDAQMSAVVKCGGYGLGVEAISKALATREGCKTFFVTYPEEGAALRSILKDLPAAPQIYVFNGPMPNTIHLFKEFALTPVLNTIEQASEWAAAHPGAPAALHADTGMNRLGAPISDIHAISEIPDLNITLFMSHLACASDPDNEMNKRQRDLFLTASLKFPKAKRSLSGSGGALMGKDYHFDLLRPGIALYGGSPFDAADARIKPVASLNAPIVQLRRARPGERVGYDATMKFERETVLATVALGYGDGFPRTASSRAKAFVGGAPAPIAGRISMDLVSLDVTDAPNPLQTGDFAEFFGPAMAIHETAAACNTISYELLTGLGDRVDRRYL